MAFLNLLDISRVLKLASEFSIHLESESVSLYDAVGRVLSEDVYADADMPPAPRSEVDGYAVRSADVKGASTERPSLLTLRGSVQVNEVPSTSVGPGEAIYVPTGAILPPGADAVVMIEHCEESHPYLEVFKPVAPRENVMGPGEDIRSGELLLKRGQRLSPEAIGLLAYLGKVELRVVRPLSVYVSATGDEIVEPSVPVGLGQYRDANTYTVAAMLKKWGFRTHRGPILKDDLTSLVGALREASESHDVVVFTGGSSAGVRDLVITAVEQCGGVVKAHGFAIRPGKPTIIGQVGRSLFVGLPGHPMSCFVSASLILLPLVRSLQGEEVQPVPLLKAKLAKSVFSRIGVEEWIPARVEVGDEIMAVPVFSKSGMVSAMIKNPAFIRVPPEAEGLEAGESVEVLTL
ncbi:molybdopterin molybdotransferase MoeA [Coprothermobacteraceae bacterium]|nr:molybdopterin molybdotransferase MoeA [Coprothermobacteraceae bacterium]